MKLNETLLIIRQNLIKIYKQYETVILMLLKFIIVFSVITMIGSSVGYIGVFNKVEVVLFLALLGTFLPEKWMVLGFVLLTPVYVAMVNLVLGIVSFVFLWVLYLLFMRLFPKESLLIIAAMMCFNIGLEGLLPVIAGLFGSYVSIIAIIIGTFIWFALPQFSLIIQSHAATKDDILSIFTNLTEGGIADIIGDKTMLCTIVVFFSVFSIVYIIRKQSIDYAPYLAIGIGLIMHLAGFVLAMVFLNIDISMGRILMTTLIIAFIAIPTQFFSKVLDYQRAEIVSFEDEDNYYYVKVVPKLFINTNHKKIKRIYNTKVEHKDYMSNISMPTMYRDQERSIDD
ncbi:hypothetical protein [Cellulosilyticum sp. I15G10I2]|uniref:hypothetical protein n=1 Tax=Cellulosilyticum sp. I15G10I2 TaxID=1892843 RepID=UPI00085CA26B|nr:hypothetical protein [Cellulosilyticum sp. I15G10I2]